MHASSRRLDAISTHRKLFVMVVLCVPEHAGYGNLVLVHAHTGRVNVVKCVGQGWLPLTCIIDPDHDFHAARK